MSLLLWLMWLLLMMMLLLLQRVVTYRTQRTGRGFCDVVVVAVVDVVVVDDDDDDVIVTEGRRLQDTENRLRANISEQKQLNEAALHAELDAKSRAIDQKMMVSTIH